MVGSFARGSVQHPQAEAAEKQKKKGESHGGTQSERRGVSSKGELFFESVW